MKIYLTFLMFLFVAYFISAQNNTNTFHFPHKTGDMWEYFYDDYSPMYVDTLQNFTIFVSADSNGIIFMKQHALFINPKTNPAVLEDTAKYWIDTVNNYVWGRDKDQGDSSLIYKLNVNMGEQWVVFDYGKLGGSNFQIARVTNKWKDTSFNKPTTFMNIYYYIAKDSTDTTGIIDLGYDEIADGFGLIARGGGDSPGEIHLIGTVINDTLYGDTAVTSIENKRTKLPISIKLYQNYPNPFNPTTTISFELNKQSNISLIIYNVLGKEILKLIDNKIYQSGKHAIIWDGNGNNGKKVSTGIYFYTIINGKYKTTKKMVLLN